MIRLSDIVFRYAGGEFELRVPGLAIDSAETIAIAGPSGSGKTTLLNLMAGIAAPASGTVRIADTEIASLDETARREFRIKGIGLVFQEFELLEYLDVLDNILLPFRIAASLDVTGEVREHAASLASEVGIGDKLKRHPSHLSHGERQRVAVCRALLAEPNLLLADEPTGNLDPANRDRVLDILFDYVSRRSATLVTVTHDHELFDRFDRVIDIRDLNTAAATT